MPVETAAGAPAAKNTAEKEDFYVRGCTRALKDSQSRDPTDTVHNDELCPRHLALSIDGFISQGLYAHQSAAESSLQLMCVWKDYKSRDVDGAMILARAELVETICKCLSKFPRSSKIASSALPLLARVASVHEPAKAAGRAQIPVIVAALRSHIDHPEAQMVRAEPPRLPGTASGATCATGPASRRYKSWPHSAHVGSTLPRAAPALRHPAPPPNHLVRPPPINHFPLSLPLPPPLPNPCPRAATRS